MCDYDNVEQLIPQGFEYLVRQSIAARAGVVVVLFQRATALSKCPIRHPETIRQQNSLAGVNPARRPVHHHSTIFKGCPRTLVGGSPHATRQRIPWTRRRSCRRSPSSGAGG